MTEIKTAKAWWYPVNGIVVLRTSEAFALEALPHAVTVVHGLTEAEVHEAAGLLEKSREVCEHRDTGIGTIRTGCDISYPVNQQHVERPCWCGRKVEIA